MATQSLGVIRRGCGATQPTRRVVKRHNLWQGEDWGSSYCESSERVGFARTIPDMANERQVGLKNYGDEELCIYSMFLVQAQALLLGSRTRYD